MTQLKTLSWLKPAIILLFLAPILGNLYLYPKADEANILLHARWLYQGALPFRDYLEFLLPGSAYTAALLYTLFGVSVVIPRLFIAGLQIISLFWLDRIAKPYLSQPWRALCLIFLVTCIIYNAYIFSHHTLSGVFALWSGLCMVHYLRNQQSDKPTQTCLILSALCNGLVIIHTQTLGVLLGISTLVFMAFQAYYRPNKQIHWGKNTGQYILFAWLIPVLLIVYLIFAGVGGDLWHGCITWLLEGHYSNTTVFGYFSTGALEAAKIRFLQPPGGFWGEWLVLPLVLHIYCIGFFPVLGVCLNTALLCVRPATLVGSFPLPEILYMALNTVACLVSTLSYSTSFHIAVNSWLGYLLFFVLLERLHWGLRHRASLQKAYTWLCVGLFILLSGHTLWVRYQMLEALLENTENRIPSYGTIEPHFLSTEGSVFDTAVSTVIERLHLLKPNTPVFIYSASPEIYLLSNTRPACRHTVIYPGLVDRDEEQEIIHRLEAIKPPVVVYDFKKDHLSQDARFRHVTGTLAALDAAIKRDYTLVYDSDDLQLFHRKLAQTGQNEQDPHDNRALPNPRVLGRSL
ncbi:MAG: hypothetical protein K2X01_02430 [Cyanobacteria bacterium]|nr:hypothetical protein [Cyanobacteriota bacterium]